MEERVFTIIAAGNKSKNLERAERNVLESEVPAQIRALLELGYFYFLIDATEGD